MQSTDGQHRVRDAWDDSNGEVEDDTTEIESAQTTKPQKIVLLRRDNKTENKSACTLNKKESKTIEEREAEYTAARERIFRSSKGRSNSTQSQNPKVHTAVDAALDPDYDRSYIKSALDPGYIHDYMSEFPPLGS
eukprot:GHVL01004881.1.p1 GENE.GHVL01004881.1~~GHVL01004881.1.p1  ORF type:complete len:135 (+),score=29.57 GHVL01004881.1:71-475(+)